jgi:hypothetical protein
MPRTDSWKRFVSRQVAPIDALVAIGGPQSARAVARLIAAAGTILAQPARSSTGTESSCSPVCVLVSPTKALTSKLAACSNFIANNFKEQNACWSKIADFRTGSANKLWSIPSERAMASTVLR